MTVTIGIGIDYTLIFKNCARIRAHNGTGNRGNISKKNVKYTEFVYTI